MVVILKKIFLFLIFLFLCSLFIGFELINTKNENLIKLKRLFPDEFKTFLKKNIFIVSDLRKQIDQLNEQNSSYEKILLEFEKKSDVANEKIFPETQFLQLNFINHDITKIKSKFNYKRYGEVVEPFYVDIWKDFLVLTLKDGQIYLLNKNSLLNNQIKFSKIDHDLNNSIEVTDILILGKKIYIMFTDKNLEKCNSGNINLYSADLDKNNIKFHKELFIKKDIKENLKFPSCLDYGATAGKMTGLNDGNILFSSTVWDKDKNLNNDTDLDKKGLITNKYASFIKFDTSNKTYEIFSNGHRNPIGVLQDSKSGNIISTEHGPRGGDEINKIVNGKNYGWPIVSYGEPYGVPYKEPYYYKKDHTKFNFEEPIYSFIPSIGISEIIEIGEKFSEKWKNNFLVGSLKKRSLYRVEFNKNFTKINFIEKIYLGRRIRDMVYDYELGLIFLALEDGKPSLGIISAN